MAFDRAIKSVEEYGYEGPVERWRPIRTQIHDEVCRAGYDLELNSFVQYYCLPAGEGVFVICTFWLVDNLVLQGRFEEAEDLFEHILQMRNDVGLLAEEFEPDGNRMLGNYPQAFSNVGLVNAARILAEANIRSQESS